MIGAPDLARSSGPGDWSTMRATVHPLVGEVYAGFELTIPASENESYEKLLKQAARICKQERALSFTVNGPFWREREDTIVLTLVISK